MYEKILYHASSEQGIKVFELGKLGTGEHSSPIPAIWFCTTMEGAAHHIKTVLKTHERLKNGTGYIYECSLSDDIVLINANNPELPLNIFKKLKAEFPLYKRLFMKRKFWYKYFYTLSEKMGSGIIEDRLHVCKILGIEALANPRRGKHGASFDEGVYGTTITVIDTSKIKILDEHRCGENDKIYQESLKDQFAL